MFIREENVNPNELHKELVFGENIRLINDVIEVSIQGQNILIC